MNVNQEYKQINNNIQRGLALGNFDGIHIGHQKLIMSLLTKGKDRNLESCVYTFMNHTIPVLKNREPIKYITNIDTKIKVFKTLGVDRLFLDTFNREIMSLSPKEFVEEILINTFNCKLAVVGFDYRFGYKAQGDVELLKNLAITYGFEVEVIDPVTFEEEKVSSSSIRNYLKNGDIEKVNNLMGRPFILNNEVIHGDGRGSKLGYPTANINVDPFQAIPKSGVYATLVKINGTTHMGATFIGTKPTFSSTRVSIETFIMDHTKDLYGQSIEIQFIKRIRGEIKFETPHDLIKQIDKDIDHIKSYLQHNISMIK
ncbi:MAG: bifunctional riboflavin kinase/FAD synthetase [Clostridiaceae bacterium]|nr:bifunctional riboflavin kinase/FAD synthetase [Clostridiaceae bacterium]